MARAGFIFTKGSTLDAFAGGSGRTRFTYKGNDGGAALATDTAALSTAIGVLVADGASPTQAHVTTANNALTLVNADLPAVQGDLQVSFDTTAITTINQLKRACDELLQAARGAGIAEG